MPGTKEAGADPHVAEVGSALAKVLSSLPFVQAARQQQLLRYLVQQTLAGRGNLLKGYTIGVEVFGRDASFDPRIDAIVRVEVSRLRSKLREYYQGEGRSEPVRFDLPKGSYAVCFSFGAPEGSPVRAENAAPPSAAAGGAEARPAEAQPSASVSIPVPVDMPSLAVLPFSNVSSDPEQEYFADGVTEDLITALSKLSGLFVISRHSVFAYKGVAKDARDIARELGVRYLLEGSVRRAGRRVRITAQLVEAATGADVWADSYDRDLEDIFAVQDDVTRRIVERLQVSLPDLESEQLVHAGTTSVEAHDILLRGLERFWEYTPESIQAAQALFTKALEVDPDYAAAHAWLARAYIYRYTESTAGREALEIAFKHASKAVEISPRLPMSQSILGWVQVWRGHGAEAIAAASRAVGMDPNNADAHLVLSVILAAVGRGEEGLRYIEKGMRLNPHPSAFYLLAVGLCYYSLKRYEEALPMFRAGAELRPAFLPNHTFVVLSCAHLGRPEEAEGARSALMKMQKRYDITRLPTIWLDKTVIEEDDRLLTEAGLV
jgi:adenylate cyclase